MHKSAILGICIVIGASGFVLGRATAGELSPSLPLSVADTGTAPALQEIRGELAELKRSLVELQLSLSTRSNVGADATSGEGLEKVVQELRALVARIQTNSNGSAASSALNLNHGSSGYASRQALESAMAIVQTRLHHDGDDEHFRADLDATARALDQQHRLLSLQELIARYGPPDKLQPMTGGLNLQYNLRSEPGLAPEFVEFQINEGLVVETALEIDR